MEPDPLSASVSMADIRARLDRAENAAANIEERLRTAYNDPLNAASPTVVQLQSRLAQTYNPQLKRAEAFRDKIGAKLDNFVANRLANAYQFTSQLGFDIPSKDDAAYAKATGDFLGSFRGGYPIPGPGITSKPNPVGTPGSVGDNPTTPTEPDITPAGGPTFPPVTPGGQRPPGGTGQTQPPQTPPQATQAQGEGYGKPGDQVIGVPITPANGNRPCPPGYSWIGTEDGVAVCWLISSDTTPPVEPPPEEIPPETEPPYTPPDDTPPPVVGPITPGPDPLTCTYPPRPSAKGACGSVPPPPQPPPKHWLEVWCEGCGYKFCHWIGDTKPDVPADHLIIGPSERPIDPAGYIRGMCKVTVGDEEEDEEEEDEEDEEEEEDTEEDEDEDADEEEEDEEEDADEDAGDDDLDETVAKVCKDIAAGVAAQGGSAEQYLNLVAAGDGPNAQPVGMVGMITSFLKADSSVVKLISGMVRNLINSWVIATNREVNCEGGKFTVIATKLAVANLFQKLFGIIPKQLMLSWQHTSNTICHIDLPDQASADRALWMGDMSEGDWACITKALGNDVELARKVLWSKRDKPNAQQIDLLFRRKYINQRQYDRLMQEAGVRKDEDRKNIHDINDAWPQLADITRMAVRDAGDEGAAAKYGTDTDFDKKVNGKILEYMEALGVPKDTMRYFWRAHWELPSYTQLTHMLFRQRPGRVPAHLVVSEQDVKDALQMNDMLPYWVEKMMAIAYHPINPSDSVKAFMIFAYDEQELREDLMDNGYKKETADKYIKYLKKEREVRTNRVSGFPTIRQLVRQYANCEITDSMFRNTLARIVISEEQEKNALEAAKVSRETRERQRTIISVRKPYMRGLLDDIQATEALSQAGIDGQCVDSLVKAWSMERLRKDKTVGAGVLCKMRERNIIGGEQQVLGLMRIGYTRSDAHAIADLCTGDINERNARKAEAAYRRAQAQLEKAQKAAEKARKAAICGPPMCPKSTPGGQAGFDVSGNYRPPQPSQDGNGDNPPSEGRPASLPGQ